MVKHQRKSHRYSHALEHDSYPSESDCSGTHSPTPDPVRWSPQLVGVQDVTQFHDMQSPPSMNFDPHLNVHSQYGHPHSVPAAMTHGVPGIPMHQQQPPPIIIQRQMNISMYPYYETDRNNPGVATMNTSMIPPYAMPRQHVGQIQLEIPSTTSSVSGSVQTSPIQFSPAVSHSSVQSIYCHQQPPYTMQSMHPTSTPLEQQPLMPYSYQHDPAEARTPHPLEASPHQLSTSTPHSLPVDTPLQTIPQAPEQNHPRASPSDEDWHSPPYEASFEEPPVEQIYLLPNMSWGDEKDYNDPSLQMPSERFNSM